MTSVFQKSPLNRQDFRPPSRLFRVVPPSASAFGKELFLKQPALTDPLSVVVIGKEFRCLFQKIGFERGCESKTADAVHRCH